jgi:hypothetical protein
MGGLCLLLFLGLRAEIFAQDPGDFLDVFASEVALERPEDLVFGPDGNLYVVSAVLPTRTCVQIYPDGCCQARSFRVYWIK